MNENYESNKPKVSVAGIIIGIIVLLFLYASYKEYGPSSGSNGYSYQVSIDSATKEIAFPDDCVYVGYTFTNKSGGDNSFAMVFDTKVYQNGIELSEAFGSVDTYTDIQSGKAIRVYEEYVVRNLFDDVEVVVYKAGTDKEICRKTVPLQNPK